MKFFYKAVQNDGKIVISEVDAENEDGALTQIARLGLKPLTLRQSGKAEKARSIFSKRGVKLEDIIFITKYLALMLKVGTDLFKAIDILANDFDKPAVKELLREMKENLEKGLPFYITFEKHPKLFSPVFTNLIRSGEVSGNLEHVFEELSESLEEERDLKYKIRSALTYPVILFVLSIFIVILLVGFSIPKIANVFSAGAIEPPTFSKWVFIIGLFVGNNLWWILALIVLIIGGGALFFIKTLTGKKLAYGLALKIPVIKKVIKELALQRFAATFSSLLTSGIPIITALEVTASSTTMPELQQSLVRIARERIAKGSVVGEAFRQEPVFPNVIASLIAISEKSGHLEEILKTISSFYTSEIESSVKSLVAFIEPVMLILIGLIIGTIALAVIIPVYQLTSSF